MNERIKTNFRVLIMAVPVGMLMACTQQHAAKIERKGDIYYGRYEKFRDGVEVPRFSDTNRAVQDPDIATKYISPKHEYSIAAPTPDVDIADAPKPKAPEPKKAKVVSRSVEQLNELPKPGTKFISADESIAELAPLPEMGEVAKSKKVAAKKPTLQSLNYRDSNFIWPVDGKVISRFGPKKNGLINDGINIAAAEGHPIWAAANGEVVYAGNELKGYGNMIIIRHRNGWMTAYAHMSDFLVDKESVISQGDLIGYVGRSGNVKDAQLHFGIRRGKTPVDPEKLLPRRVASAAH